MYKVFVLSGWLDFTVCHPWVCFMQNIYLFYFFKEISIVVIICVFMCILFKGYFIDMSILLALYYAETFLYNQLIIRESLIDLKIFTTATKEI